MTTETLKTAAQADKYFDTQRLTHGPFRLTDIVRVQNYPGHTSVAFRVSCGEQVSYVSMNRAVLKHVIDTFNDSERTAARFAGSGPDEVAKRGMDRLLPEFITARDKINSLDEADRFPARDITQADFRSRGKAESLTV